MAAISTSSHIEGIFELYRGRARHVEFPNPGRLTESLNLQAQRARTRNAQTFAADSTLVRMFASAAIEMWHRAIHSFIISAGLTSTSVIWSSVAGYYASHYVLRGYAHLLGRYLLYAHKKIVVLGRSGSSYYCRLEGKHASEREHKAYWRFVRDSVPFGNDPFLDVDIDVIPRSDGAHRNKANYSDHLGDFTAFRALKLSETAERIRRISEIEITALPIPNAAKFPDLENVQIIAYHRIVGFRKYLDDLLGDGNRFWNTHRTPAWCAGVVDFQIVDPQLPLAPASA